MASKRGGLLTLKDMTAGSGCTPRTVRYYEREGLLQAARSSGDYTLVGCSVAPGFEFADFTMLRDLPDLAAMDDGIANGTHSPHPGEALPLSLFTAPRVDYSLQRLRHYTGTAPEWFQNFVLFTNYQFYMDEFIAMGHAAIAATTLHNDLRERDEAVR